MKKNELYKVAKKSRENSYSPYSKHKVGAALVTKTGKIFGGCNVENASYGGTICAERVAIQTAVASEGKISIKEILVITDHEPAWTPCGFCRQVIAEFATKDTKIHISNLKGIQSTISIAELLPFAFEKSSVMGN